MIPVLRALAGFVLIGVLYWIVGQCTRPLASLRPVLDFPEEVVRVLNAAGNADVLTEQVDFVLSNDFDAAETYPAMYAWSVLGWLVLTAGFIPGVREFTARRSRGPPHWLAFAERYARAAILRFYSPMKPSSPLIQPAQARRFDHDPELADP